MAINTLPTSAVNGIQRGLRGMRRAAVEIAAPPTANSTTDAPPDIARSLVELKQHAVQARASTRALKAYNDALGSLVDTRA